MLAIFAVVSIMIAAAVWWQRRKDARRRSEQEFARRFVASMPGIGKIEPSVKDRDGKIIAPPISISDWK